VRTDELAYDLPPELIAQRPAERRDGSRLLVVHRQTGRLEHAIFLQLADFISPGSLLILNDTRVVPARFEARRSTGGRVPGLFLRQREPGDWEALLEGRGRLRKGQTLALGGRYVLALTEPLGRGVWRIRVEPAVDAERVLAEVGRTPLPPYIRRKDDPTEILEMDRERYQTIYARQPGAVAAPTAGLHFTEGVFASLAARGIQTATVTLHVGLGTFAPIEAEELADHRMHAEWYEMPAATVEAVQAARARGSRIVAVGTTAARVLESCADPAGHVHAGSGWTDLFIHPPYRFRAVDALVTNFHLPRSTLLAMIFAFGGTELIRAAYAEAIARRYRFYSYGDAMLIL